MKNTLLRKGGIASAVLGLSLVLSACGGGGGGGSSAASPTTGTGSPTTGTGSPTGTGSSGGTPTSSNYTQTGYAIDGPVTGTVYVYDMNTSQSLVAQASVINGQFQIVLPNAADTYVACVVGQDGSYTISTSSPFSISTPTYFCGIFNFSPTSNWFINPLTNYVTYLTFSGSSFSTGISSSSMIQTFLNSLSSLGIQYQNTIDNFVSATSYVNTLSQIFGPSSPIPQAWVQAIISNTAISSSMFPQGIPIPYLKLTGHSPFNSSYTMNIPPTLNNVPDYPYMPSVTIAIRTSQLAGYGKPLDLPGSVTSPFAYIMVESTTLPNYYYDQNADLYYCSPSQTICTAIASGYNPNQVFGQLNSDTAPVPIYYIEPMFSSDLYTSAIVNDYYDTIPSYLFNCDISGFLQSGTLTCDLYAQGYGLTSVTFTPYGYARNLY